MFWSSKKKKPEADKSWPGRLKAVIEKYKSGGGTALQPVAPEVVKAFLAPTIYTMLSDGERQAQEEIQLLSMLTTSPVMRGQTPQSFGEHIDALIAHFGQIGGREDRDKLVQLAKNLPSELRSSAYAYAVRMAFADQSQTPEEARALDDLQEWLNVDSATAQAIRASMALLTAVPPRV